MTKEFGVDDLVHTADLYDKINTFNDDIPFYKELCKSKPGPALELCCGTGRITVELTKSGVDITGLDFTESMLNAAKVKLAENNLQCDLHLGDMRNFSLNKMFGFIFIPFNSIQNTYEIQDIENTFNCVKKHLEPNGTFALDIFNPDLNYLVREENELEEIFNFKLDSGEDVKIKQSMKYDKKNQINRVKWHHYINGVEKIQKLDMRCFYPLELDMLLKYNGFEVVSKFGNFDKSPFESNSPKQIYVCKLK